MEHRFNTQRKFGEAKCYVHLKINGKSALFTEEQLQVAFDRAVSHPEDIPQKKKPWWKFW